jgi:hypothetical protein
MPQRSTSDLAEKIAQILEAETRSADLSAIRASLDKINERLEKLEKLSTTPQPDKSHLSVHPSQDKFAVAEAIADEIFANYKKEKACTFEPNGKPCDHCSMCSSRGF